jgi:hypothetical protein
VGNWQAGDELSGSRWSGWTPGGTAGTAADAGDLTENTTLPMCFATPAHNETLDGSWVPRTALPGISATHLETSCKGFQPRLGRWEFATALPIRQPATCTQGREGGSLNLIAAPPRLSTPVKAGFAVGKPGFSVRRSSWHPWLFRAHFRKSVSRSPPS